MRPLYKIKGLGFVFWHSRHMFYHLLIGLVWAWFLREIWNTFSLRWITLSVGGSLLPDIDHFIYFLGYGNSDSYTKQIREFIRGRQWRNLCVYVENGHKHNTHLRYHNYYTMAFLLVVIIISSIFEWQSSVILTGAMFFHYAFDICDDVLTLGHVNSNWRRWGRG